LIALDTNVLVRYIVQDDPHQARAATLLIEGQISDASPGFVSDVVLVELVWVLQGYGYSRSVIADVLTRLLSAIELRIERVELAWSAMRAYRQGPADFADYLLGEQARSAGCSVVKTFDRKAARSTIHELIPTEPGESEE